MTLRTFALQALHSAGAAPRIFAAARHAGAAPVEAGRVVATSVAVLLEARRRSGGRPWRENALRHFAWQAVLAARHGQHVALAVAEANEVGGSDQKDRIIDESNNASGRDWAAQHEELARLPLPRAISTAFTEAAACWDDGGLAGPQR